LKSTSSQSNASSTTGRKESTSYGSRKTLRYAVDSLV
jgi:hypothetical protein